MAKAGDRYEVTTPFEVDVDGASDELHPPSLRVTVAAFGRTPFV